MAFNWDDYEDAPSENAPILETAPKAEPDTQSFNWNDYATVETPSLLDRVSSASQPAGDLLGGFTKGATMGGADEIGGGLSALLDLGQRGLNKLGLAPESASQVDARLKEQGFTGDLGPTTTGEVYRDAQKDSEQDFKDMESRSPLAFGLGEFGGAVGAGLATAGLGSLAAGTKAGVAVGNLASKVTPSALSNFLSGGSIASKAIKGGAALAGIGALEGAAYGALSSEGNLDTEAGRSQMMDDTLDNAATGSIIGGLFGGGASLVGDGVKAIGRKAGDIIDNSNTMRQIGVAFDEGTQGINYTHSGQLEEGFKDLGPLSLRETLDAKKIRTAFEQADSALGKQVGDSLKSATDAGKRVDISQAMGKNSKSLQDYFMQNPNLFDDPSVMRNVTRMFSHPTSLTPLEARGVLSELDNLTKLIQRSPDPYTNKMLMTVQDLRKGVDKELKTQVPEYAKAAKRFATARSAMGETILTEGTPVDARKAGDIIGDTLNSDNKLQNKIEKMLMTARRDGATPGNKTLAALGQELKILQKEENLRMLNGEIKPGQDFFSLMGFKNADDVLDTIKAQADRSAAMRTAQKTSLVEEGGQMVMQRATGIGGAGQGMGARTANTLGRWSPTIKKLNPYEYGPKQLMATAKRVQASPSYSHWGQKLEDAINSNDVARKNAVLFSMMQIPELRLDVFSSSEESEGEDAQDDNQ